jgi:hypothetical protein
MFEKYRTKCLFEERIYWGFVNVAVGDMCENKVSVGLFKTNTMGAA